MIYRFLRTPPSPPADQAPTDKAATPPVAQPSAPTPVPAPVPDQAPDQAPDQTAPVEQHAMLSPPPPPRLSNNRIADRILVEKNARRLTLFRNDKPIKSYEIALGRQPVGAKQFEGDNKTPEGHYVIDFRKRDSAYHRALHISYPRPQEVAFAARKKRSAGGNIMIHGLPNGMGSMGALHRLRDWTAGCIAVTNNEIEELWRTIPDGTPIEIRP
ncbi:MAG: L,D-transpeptidase family protein [Candidatus Competibacter sp.]|nr:L,D-transpeptidase family protein [Candidatus Competibacter sp.]MDG4584220.1 L,D-transpeptidase family protein [Candidatus Competibacter sp.]